MCHGNPPHQKIRKSGTSDFDNFGFWKCCSWISRLCGIGRRLRRLQRPGVVSFEAFTRNSKSQQKPTFPKIGNIDRRKILKHVLFLKTLGMEHAIAENDRTARETPVKNCRASELSPPLLPALLGVWYKDSRDLLALTT